MIILNDTPEIFYVDNYLSAQCCAELIEWSLPHYEPGTTLDPSTSQYIVSDYRTSLLWRTNDKIDTLVKLQSRLKQDFGLDPDYTERLQFVQYEEGQYYKPHYDFFWAEHNIKTASGDQRLSTYILYLNDVTAGGETSFNRLKMRVLPRRGRLLKFRYDYDNHTINKKTMHEALPVLKGTKFIATFWQRKQKQIT